MKETILKKGCIFFVMILVAGITLFDNVYGVSPGAAFLKIGVSVWEKHLRV